jgi:ATP-dependent protease ClpP protease subunit
MEGHIFTDGVIGEDYHLELKNQLANLGPSASITKIIHHISSPGGSVYGGYKGYHVLKSYGKPITSVIEGEAQSMATFVAMAGNEIIILEPSIWMIHNPSQGLKGDADALRGGADELQMIEDTMAQAYADRTGKPIETIKTMMKNETRMTPDQAVSFGFATEKRNKLMAVAIGKKMETNDKTLIEQIAGIFKKHATASGPTAIDLPLQAGGTINVTSDNGDLVGKPATMNGAPCADGEYPLTDGRTLVVTAGMVQEVKTAAAVPPPAPTQQDALKAQIAALQAQLATKTTAEQAALTQAQTAQQTAQAAVTAMAEIKKEIEVITKTTVGDASKPDLGIIANRQPVGMSPTAAAKEKEKTFNFLMEHMSWLKAYYPEDEIAKYASGPNMVSILETGFNYTYPGIFTTEIFYKPTLQAPAISDIFTIDQGISFKKKYNLVTQLDKILKPYNGCTRTFNGNRQIITNTEVVTKEFQVSESWCKDDFTSQLTGAYNFLAQEWLKTGNKSFDPSGTPINQIIDRVLMDALQRDVFRRVSFAAGNSSDDDYNQFDGLWDRLIDTSGASNYCVRRAGTSLGTGALSSGNSLTHLENAYASSNILLKNASGKKFLVTRSIWDNYYNSLIGTGAVTEQAFENLQKGLTTLTYKGIPVIPVDLWDQFLTETDNPLYGVTAHLILLTVKENHILGVEQGSDLNKIEGWYERKDRKFYYEADMKFGYNYLHCDLQTIMY